MTRQRAKHGGKRSTFSLERAELYARLAFKAAMHDQDEAKRLVRVIRDNLDLPTRKRIVALAVALRQAIELDPEARKDDMGKRIDVEKAKALFEAGKSWREIGRILAKELGRQTNFHGANVKRAVDEHERARKEGEADAKAD